MSEEFDAEAEFDRLSGGDSIAEETKPGSAVESEQSDTPAASEEVAEPGTVQTPTEVPPAIAAELAKKEHAAKSDAGRVAALQRQNEALKKQMEELRSRRAAPAEDEEWKKSKDEYPEILGSVEDKIGKVRAEVTQEILNQVAEQQLRQQEQELNLKLLDNECPDWREVAQDSSFNEWVKAGTPLMLQQYNSMDYRDVSQLLEAYKMRKGGKPPANASPLETKRAVQLESGATIPRKDSAPVTTGAPDDPDAAFDYYVKKRRKRE